MGTGTCLDPASSGLLTRASFTLACSIPDPPPWRTVAPRALRLQAQRTVVTKLWLWAQTRVRWPFGQGLDDGLEGRGEAWQGVSWQGVPTASWLPSGPRTGRGVPSSVLLWVTPISVCLLRLSLWPGAWQWSPDLPWCVFLGSHDGLLHDGDGCNP